MKNKTRYECQTTRKIWNKNLFSFPQKVPILPVSEDLEGSCPYGIDNNDDNRGSVSSTITDDQTTMRASCSDILQQNRWVHFQF